MATVHLSSSLGTLISGPLSHHVRSLRALSYDKAQKFGGATGVFLLAVPAKVHANNQINCQM